MNIFVTGAGGFIGQELCAQLHHQGHEVTGLFRSVRTTPPFQPRSGDLTDIKTWESDLAGMDCVVHLAAIAHGAGLEGSPKRMMEVNQEASAKLAQACISQRVRRLVFVSSIGVNGNETVGAPICEESQCIPHTPYAMSKYNAELELKTCLQGSPVELVIVRPPLVFASRAPGNFGRMIKLVSTGLPLPFGAIHNKRSIISLSSLCCFLQLAVIHPRAAGELFVVSDAPAVSTAQMMNAIARGMNKRTIQLAVPRGLIFQASRMIRKEGLFQALCGSLEVDSTKAQEMLGWKPEQDVLEALETVGKKILATRV